jgi:hypothetical protein
MESTSFNGLFESLGNVGHLASVAKRLGLTVEETQRLGMAASKAGIDLDSMSNFMLLMSKNVGTGGMSLDKRLGMVADEFVKIKDVGQRAEFARGVFGKGGFDMMNLLAKGSSGIRQSADAIDKFGLAIKDVDAAKAKESLLALKEIKEVAGGLKDKLAVELAPTLTEFFKGMLGGLSSAIDLWKQLNALALAGPGSEGMVQKSFLDSFSTVMGGGVIGVFRKMFGGAKPESGGGGIGGVADMLGGAVGGGAAHFASGAAEKGSLEAGRLTQQAKTNQFSDALKPIADKLDAIKKNTDPNRAKPVPGMARGRI